MTVHFPLYQTPTDPEAFDRHYRQVHIPLGRRAAGATAIIMRTAASLSRCSED
jgi:hypothetical protein